MIDSNRGSKQQAQSKYRDPRSWKRFKEAAEKVKVKVKQGQGPVPEKQGWRGGAKSDVDF